jgi:Peptidase S24-like
VIALISRAVEKQGATTLTVRGNSMAPTMRDRDQVRLERFDFDYVVPGQIVAAHVNGGIFVHRVRYRTALGLLLAGDNNITLDASVPREAYLGVVTAHRRIGGDWIDLEHFAPLSRPAKSLELLLPEAWFALLDAQPRDYQSLQLQSINEAFPSEFVAPNSCVGISPFGLEDDDWFIAQLEAGATSLLCFAGFGAPGMARTPVNRVRGVARLSVFNLLQPESPSGLRDFLAFLDGMVSCALVCRRQS